MATARDWGMTPDQWYAATRAARAMMIATSIMRVRVENEMVDHGR
jgi:hypothetical protein